MLLADLGYSMLPSRKSTVAGALPTLITLPSPSLLEGVPRLILLVGSFLPDTDHDALSALLIMGVIGISDLTPTMRKLRR